MLVSVSATIKIAGSPALVRSMAIYKKGLQLCVDEGFSREIKNNIKLQPFVYSRLRQLGLQSQAAIACIKQACGMLKKAESKPKIDRSVMRYNFPRSASFSGNQLSLWTIEGRQKFDFSVPENFKEYFKSWEISESLLRIDKKGRCSFIFCFSKETTQRSSEGVLGIDRGIKNLAVCSDNRFFRAGKARKIKRQYHFLRQRLQAKGTRAAKRLLRKVSGKERRFMADVNHCISKQIVEKFTGNKIILEDLSGSRKQKKKKGKRFNKMLHGWSFLQLQEFITYKAMRKGISVELVDPRYTSKLCHKCGALGSRTGSRFSCSSCGLLNYHADLNAAKNLSHPTLGERQASVNKPHVTSSDASSNLAEGSCKPLAEARGI